MKRDRRELGFKPVLRLDSALRSRIQHKLAFDKRDIEFDLPEWYIALLYRCTHCFYTGTKFTRTNSLTLERIDNNKGYVIGNVIPVGKTINMLKSNFSDEELVYEIEKFEDKNSINETVYNDTAKRLYDAKAIVRDYMSEDSDVPDDQAVSLIKKIKSYREIMATLEQVFENNDYRIKQLEIALTASTHYASMSKHGIILCLMYQQDFNLEDKFGVSI